MENGQIRVNLAVLLFFRRIGLLYREGPKSLRLLTQRSACLTLSGNFKTNDSKGESAIYYDAVYIYSFGGVSMF